MSSEEKTPMLEDGGESGPTAASRNGRTKFSKVIVLLAAVVTPALLLSKIQDVTTSRIATDRDDMLSTNDAFAMPDELRADIVPTDLLGQCEEKFFAQTLDHFDIGAPTYQERYFVCDEHFRPGGVMFFYVGNEADVELYLNHTGLMWENAQEFGAMLVFAEHRYFGKSVPFGTDVTKHMQYLSTEQAIADYAVLITYLKEEYKRDVPVIGFGGSYGGMLGSWFRMKYPHIIDGVIAASAPILSYFGDEVPYDIHR